MSIDIGTQTITRNPTFSSSWSRKRLNQKTRRTADGGRVTYDNGPDDIYGTIVLKGVSKAEGDSFRTWLVGTAVYGKNSFSIDPPANTDVGAGDGTELTTCFYDGGENIDGVLTYVAPGKYNIKFPYRKTS